jgi:hypothetical protein
MAHSEKINAEIWAEDKAKSVQKTERGENGSLQFAAGFGEVAG